MDAANNDQELELASVTLVDGLAFCRGHSGGVYPHLDARESVGPSGGWLSAPSLLLLLTLGGCTAMDVLSILRKKRQQVSGLSVEVQGSRADQHPRVYTRFDVLYRVRGTNIDPQAVARAIELSTTRYCPVIGLLGEVAEVATHSEIE